MSLSGLPPIDQTLLPPDVRDAPAATQSAYRSALGFEQLLVQQLTSSMADSTKDAFGGEDSPYASMLPDALADAVMNGGGLGLAPQLAASLEPSS